MHILNLFGQIIQSENLMKMDLPKEVKKVLGDRKTWKIPKTKKKGKDKKDEQELRPKDMERDLRKITESIKDLDEDQRKYAKLSILKYYDILFETFCRYCKIGGDKYWLTQNGWNALISGLYLCLCLYSDFKNVSVYN